MKKIHPTFHIALLEKTHRAARTATNIQFQNAEEENTEYEAEKIEDFKRVSGKPHYLVKWRGYPTSENTWEPIDHLRNCAVLLREYHTSQHQ